jgi:hypothetical protein
MIIKNKQIESVLKVLNYPTKFSLARQRDKFILELSKKMDEFNSELQKIYKEFCDKDAEGNPVVSADNKYSFTTEGAVDNVNNEYAILIEESFEIPHSVVIHDLINNSPVELDLGVSAVIEEVLSQTKDEKAKPATKKSAKKAGK